MRSSATAGRFEGAEDARLARLEVENDGRGPGLKEATPTASCWDDLLEREGPEEATVDAEKRDGRALRATNGTPPWVDCEDRSC